MSTIKVNKIENTATADGGISIDASGHVEIDGVQLPNAGALSNRNLFVNGGARIAQRSTSETGVTSSGYKTVDQFKVGLASLGTWTVSQETDAPAGFSNSLKMDCTTADSSPSANDVCAIDTFVEAQNLQVLEYGSASAVAATLSFYVKSNKTGSGTVSILQDDNSNRCINVSYTISSANTWERKTISLPADASGVINNDNGRGFIIEYWLNSGSTYTGGSAQTTWGSLSNTNRNFANLGIGGSTDDYWQITGVQLEVGEKATPFEHRSYGDELARCQRYYYMIGNDLYAPIVSGAAYASNNFYGVRTLPVSMRTSPTLDTTNSSNHFTILSNGSDHFFDSVVIGESRTTAVELRANSSVNLSGVTAGHAAWMRCNNASAHIAATAEL